LKLFLLIGGVCFELEQGGDVILSGGEQAGRRHRNRPCPRTVERE
jgi:hypothetical protein